MLLLTLRDLQYRATRFLLVIIGTALVFTLLLVMSGLTEQFKREPALTVAGMGADRWLLRAGATGAFTSAATLDPAAAEALPRRATADPLVAGRHSLTTPDGPVDIVVVGFARGGMGSPGITEGKQVAAANQVVVDETANLEVGDAARIGSMRFRVSGVTEDATLFAGMPLVFMRLAGAQELLYRGQDVFTAILVRGERVSAPRGYALLSNDQIADDAQRPLENAISSVNLIRGLLWVVSAMIVGGVVYLSSLERRRDFAVLKAVGSSNRTLLGGLALQGVLIAVTAAAVAIALQAAIAPVFPLKVQVTTGLRIQLPLIAAALALVASIGGLRQVSRADPAAAFAGPGT